MDSVRFEYKLQPNVESISNNRMSLKAIVFFALVAVAFAGPPRVGLRMPFLPQVVGGSEASKADYPHLVSLQWGIFESSTSHFCAGSILNAKWILTAGHCILAAPPGIGSFVVKAGKHNINLKEDSEQIVRVSKTFVHEQYAGGVAPYDIGLIQLETPLKFTKEVQPIRLPNAGNEPNGDAILCGWGSTSSSGSQMPDELQHIDLHFVTRAVCHESVERLTGSSPVHETNVCTGPLTGGMSACSGDSGGSLITINNGKQELAGVVSWGIIPCGTIGAPSVYTKVSEFVPWINTIQLRNK